MNECINSFLNERERAILSRAKIGIAGAGGLGSNCAMHLVRSGIKKICVVDFDVVSPSNLNRQFFFKNQLGLPKVEALKSNLLQIEPTAEITAICEKLTTATMLTHFADCDLLIEAFDNPQAKQDFIHQAIRYKKTIIAASGIAGWGQSNEIKIKKIGQYAFLIGDEKRSADNLNDFPFSPRVGIVAAMQANTAISVLLNLPY